VQEEVDVRTPVELIEAVAQAGEAYAVLLESLPEAAFHRQPAPEAWSAAEITGHVAEFPLTKAKQVLQVASTLGMRIGRARDDPGRLAALRRLNGAGPAEAAAAVRATVQEAVGLLGTLKPEQMQVTVEHSRWGTITVYRMIERLLEHLGEHLEQAQIAAGVAPATA
jgi:DinB superfamily